MFGIFGAKKKRRARPRRTVAQIGDELLKAQEAERAKLIDDAAAQGWTWGRTARAMARLGRRQARERAAVYEAASRAART